MGAKKKADKATIRQHIESFHPQVSHYNREHAPNHRYLDPTPNVTSMWKDYTENHQQMSYSVYFSVFKILNVGFKNSSQDECFDCAQYKSHDTTNRDYCEKCKNGQKHHENAQKARHQYQQDRDNIQESTAVFAADMQRVILLPKLATKEHFFVSR